LFYVYVQSCKDVKCTHFYVLIINFIPVYSYYVYVFTNSDFAACFNNILVLVTLKCEKPQTNFMQTNDEFYLKMRRRMVPHFFTIH